MSNNFYITIKPILFLIKFVGIINISYTMEEQTKLLVQDPNTVFYEVLEVIRMLILLILTYYYLTSPYQTILKQFYLLTFWKTIIAARISETWMVKFINGIVEFDEKIVPLLSRLSAQQRSISKTRWNMFFILIFMYFLLQKLICTTLYPPRELDIYFLTDCIMAPPFMIHFVVFISTYFFLFNLYIRFEKLNDLWRCLPDGLVAIPDQWTHLEVVILMDDIRLLHSELSELLKIFSQCYGPLLIIFFASTYINVILQFFFVYSFSKNLPQLSSTKTFLRMSIQFLSLGQSIFTTMIIMFMASFINAKRIKIIHYARMNRITNLPTDIKRQIKMLMNQVSVYESDEITAFGLFKINLNLAMSILTLLIIGITTFIQMKNHPIFLKYFNEVYFKATHQFTDDFNLATDFPDQ